MIKLMLAIVGWLLRSLGARHTRRSQCGFTGPHSSGRLARAAANERARRKRVFERRPLEINGPATSGQPNRGASEQIKNKERASCQLAHHFRRARLLNDERPGAGAAEAPSGAPALAGGQCARSQWKCNCARRQMNACDSGPTHSGRELGQNSHKMMGIMGATKRKSESFSQNQKPHVPGSRCKSKCTGSRPAQNK